MTPDSLRLLTTPQGSASQVSMPSLTRTTVVSTSLVLSDSATSLMEAAMGVLPLGLMALTLARSPSRSSEPEGIITSTSEQSPLRLWP